MIQTFSELRKSRKYSHSLKNLSNTEMVSVLDKVINFAKMKVAKEACGIHTGILNKILSNKLITIDNRP